MTLLSTKFRKEHRVHKTITKSLAQSLSTQGFSTTTLLTFGLMILRCGGCTVQCRIFSSTPGLYTLHANSTPSLTTVVIIKVVFRYCQMSPGEAKLPGWEPWLISNSPFPEPYEMQAIVNPNIWPWQGMWTEESHHHVGVFWIAVCNQSAVSPLYLPSSLLLTFQVATLSLVQKAVMEFDQRKGCETII